MSTIEILYCVIYAVACVAHFFQTSLVRLKPSILELKIILLRSLKCNLAIEQSETVSKKLKMQLRVWWQ